MTRYLIVANQTLGGEDLVAWMDDNVGSDGEVQFVVPVTDTQGTTQWEYPPIHRAILDAKAVAEKLAAARLEHELDRLQRLGITARGDVVDPDPVEHIQRLLAAGDVDVIVVATLPHRLSRWLRTDMPHRLQRAIDREVVQLQSSAGPSV